MNKNQIYVALLALGLLHLTPSFAANATERSMIRSAMYNKLTTAAQMIEYFKTLARNGEEQLINLYIPTFVDRLKKEAAEGALSQPQIDGLRTDAVNAIKLLKKDSAAPISKLNNLTAGITTTQQAVVTPIPTPITGITEQSYRRYINALVNRIYKASLLYIGFVPAQATLSRALATAIYRSTFLPTDPSLKAQAEDYKQRLLDLLQTAATNDTVALNTKMSEFPLPIAQAGVFEFTSAYNYFTYADYLYASSTDYSYPAGTISRKYSDMLYNLARQANLFSSITQAEIDAAIQAEGGLQAVGG